MSNDNGIITGHFITHWGVPSDIRPIEARGVKELAILEFAPKGPRATWRYATNGMSSYAQLHPDENLRIRTELYACTKHKATWVADLLMALASYPQDYSTYLAEFDTINVDQPIDRRSSSFTGILLAPPDPSTLGLVGGLAYNVLVHQVVGVLSDELQFAEECGGKSLWHKLMNRGERVLDEKQPSVV